MEQHESLLTGGMDKSSAAIAYNTAVPGTTEDKEQQNVYKSPIARLWALRAVWIVVSCIGGPIMLYVLSNTKLQPEGHMYYEGTGLPCDVAPLWSSWGSLLQINVRTGKMSFAAAKVLDVAFDLVVGRCGQLLLAWYSGRTIRDVLTRLAKDCGVSLKLFVSLALETHSLETAIRSQTAWRWSKSQRAIAILCTTSLTILYVVAFPTIVSTATSPITATETSIRLPANDTAPVDAFLQTAAFRFNDTGLPDAPTPWIVLANEIMSLPSYSTGNCAMMMVLGGNSWTGNSAYNDLVLHNGTKYSLGNDSRVDCGFYYGTEYILANPKGLEPEKIYNTYSDSLICLPVGDGTAYQWGASWELLFIITILHIVWSILLLALSMEASHKSDLVRHGRRSLAMWRALSDIGTVLYDIVDPVDMSRSTEKQLEKEVELHPLVTYEETGDERGETIGIRLRAVGRSNARA
ncbi:hypothetical protein F4780DRAFT_477 [Xylariomycetidae sp. FL0641]|nr:hypothetical protein F4780DRAFT_477 [Xylariomycetidae sp. FL0641]